MFEAEHNVGQKPGFWLKSGFSSSLCCKQIVGKARESLGGELWIEGARSLQLAGGGG